MRAKWLLLHVAQAGFFIATWQEVQRSTTPCSGIQICWMPCSMRFSSVTASARVRISLTYWFW